MPAPHIELWAVLALLPLLVYANALSRGKSAPWLRGPYAPYALLLISFAAVYFTGDRSSPLFGVYALLTLLVAALSGIRTALVLALVVSVGEALLSWSDFSLASLAPLALPWVGVILGALFRNRGGAETHSLPASSVPILKNDFKEDLGDEALPVPVLDPHDVLHKNATSLIDLAYHAHPSWNALLLLWFENNTLRLRQGRVRQGTLNMDFQVTEGDGLLGWPLREKKRLTVAELAPTTAQALSYYLGERKAKALLATPFFDEGDFLGMLVVDRGEAGEWTEDEISAAEFLGRQVTQVNQLATLVGRVQTRSRKLSELYEVSKQLFNDLDQDLLMQRMAGLLGRLLEFDSFYLAMREGEGGEFAMVTSLGYEASYQNAFTLQEDTDLGGWVLTSGEPVIFNSSHAQASIPKFLSAGLQKEAVSFLLIPLLRQHQISGLLKLDRRPGAPGFTEQDKELALIFASQAAITLEHARLYTQHKRMATTDGLTGLYNHRYFQERLALELDASKRTGKPLSLALTDIDFFKKFNDTFGHQEGDNVLRKVSRLIQEKVRGEQDIVCRYGGEEFVIILPECDLVEAREVAERVRSACAETLVGGQGPDARAITLSIGLCSYPLGAQEQREVIHKADEALYKAKQTGRNKTCSFKDLP